MALMLELKAPTMKKILVRGEIKHQQTFECKWCGFMYPLQACSVLILKHSSLCLLLLGEKTSFLLQLLILLLTKQNAPALIGVGMMEKAWELSKKI